MGNTVSAHICQLKVFRPYPVVLYRLRLDPSIHWWKKLVSLGTTKFGVSMVRYLHMYDKFPI